MLAVVRIDFYITLVVTKKKYIMNTFNKYVFLYDLKETIEQEFASETSENSITDIIHREVDNAVIYYSQCYQIIAECGVTDFENHDILGTPTNIQQLAYIALYDFVNDNL